MKNPLILNIRCVCIDEYMELQRIHNNYRKLRSEGEILSIYVGARRELYGQNKIVDKLLDKVFGDKSKPIPTERIMREEVVGAQGNGDGTVTETVERTFVPPEKPLTLDEARAIGAGYAEQEEKSSITEFAVGDRAEEFHYEEEPVPANLFPGPAVETEVHKSFQHVPETLDNDVLVGTEPFSTFSPQEFTQSEPSVTEAADDGADWNNYAN